MSDTAPAEASARPASHPDPAVRRFEQRMRPWRRGYVGAIVVALLGLLVIVKIAYAHGEISHATLHTIASPPRSVPLTSPNPNPQRAWSTSDATALGTPYYAGTIVTFDRHTVRGRAATTGKQTWSYTRTDRTVCTAMQLEAVTIAVYQLNGNCDELTALATDTGHRQWTRTLDMDSNQINRAINGFPHFAVGAVTAAVWTSHIIYAIDPSGDQDTGNKNAGLDRWEFAHAGCTIHSLVLGQNGAMISQTCTGAQCAGIKFCGNGPQLLLRDPLKGENTDSSTNDGNPDQILWARFGNTSRPASADGVLSSVSADGTELDLLSKDHGTVVHRLPLNGGTGPVTTTPAQDAQLIRFGGVTYAVKPGAASFLWQRETTALPTVFSSSGLGTPYLRQARITVATSSGIAELSAADGTPQQTFAVPPPPPGSTVFPFGSGFLVAGPQTVLYR